MLSGLVESLLKKQLFWVLKLAGQHVESVAVYQRQIVVNVLAKGSSNNKGHINCMFIRPTDKCMICNLLHVMLHRL